MSVKFCKDKSGGLEAFCEAVKDKTLPAHAIHLAKILYIFWEGEIKDSEGYVKHGEARIASNRERDLYGYDFIISVDREYWNGGSIRDRIRLAYHELLHCIVLVEEGSTPKHLTPKEDSEGRLKIKVRQHDVRLNLFFSEIRRCGLSGNEREMTDEIAKYDKKHRVRDYERIKKMKKGKKK